MDEKPKIVDIAERKQVQQPPMRTWDQLLNTQIEPTEIRDDDLEAEDFRPTVGS